MRRREANEKGRGRGLGGETRRPSVDLTPRAFSRPSSRTPRAPARGVPWVKRERPWEGGKGEGTWEGEERGGHGRVRGEKPREGEGERGQGRMRRGGWPHLVEQVAVPQHRREETAQLAALHQRVRRRAHRHQRAARFVERGWQALPKPQRVQARPQPRQPRHLEAESLGVREGRGRLWKGGRRTDGD